MRTNQSTSAGRLTTDEAPLQADGGLMGMGELGEDGMMAIDPLAGGGEKRRFNSGSLVVIIVVVVACAGLWMMRSLTNVSASGGDGKDIEATIEKFLSGVKPGGANSSAIIPGEAGVLAVLTEEYTGRQVPLENVQRNPFIIDGEPKSNSGPTPPTTDRNRVARVLEIERAATKFELKSVIMGSQPLANVSGRVVKQGDELLSQPEKIPFRVSTITADRVTLIAEDKALGIAIPFELTITREF